MKIGYCFLENVKDVNSYDNVSELELIRGNAGKIYFQLVDANSPTPDCEDLYRRYIPASGVTVVAFFDHIADSKQITRVASQPFPEDSSIWSVDILTTDKLALNSLEVTVTEGATVTKAVRLCELRIRSTDEGQFFC